MSGVQKVYDALIAGDYELVTKLRETVSEDEWWRAHYLAGASDEASADVRRRESLQMAWLVKHGSPGETSRQILARLTKSELDEFRALDEVEETP